MVFTSDAIRKLIEDWRNERDPSDAYIYADTMASILEALLIHVPDGFAAEIK